MLILLLSLAFGKDCDDLLREQTPFIIAQARSFVIKAPYLARRLAVDADDVAQELLIALWRGLDRIDHNNERAVGFIRNRLNWRATDLMRRAKAKPDLVAELDSESAISKDVNESEKLDELRTVLDLGARFLSPRNFQYFYLYANGLEFSQIAEVYGVQAHSVYHSVESSIKRISKHD